MQHLKPSLKPAALASPYSPRVARKHNVRAAASSSHMFTVPLFTLPGVLHPTQTGAVRVFEPRYLAMFQDLQQQYKDPTAIRFGHILAPGAAPPALLQDAVGGLPKVGVMVAVQSVTQLPDNTLVVEYVGQRRFSLMLVDDDEKPYKLGAANWYDDVAGADLSPQDQRDLDALEQRVFALITDLNKALSAHGGPLPASSDNSGRALSPPGPASVGGSARGPVTSSSSSSQSGSDRGDGSKQRPGLELLPPGVWSYAPPPPEQKSLAWVLQDAGVAAGHHIAMYQRMGSVYDSLPARKKQQQDPYLMVREQVGKERRQELFSFAAASVLEMGVPEKLALLGSQDTAARLHYVSVAVQPYLQQLLTSISMRNAVGL